MDDGTRSATLPATQARSDSIPVGGVLPGASGVYAVAESCASLWSALIEDVDAAVLVVDFDGFIVFSNTRAMRFMGKSSPPSAGRRLADLWDAPIADERLSVVRTVSANAKPLTLEGLVQGRWSRMCFRPLPPDASGRRRVLVVSCLATPSTTPTSPQAVRAKHDDPGPLGVLTARELQILKMIGAGLNSTEIARKLHRSVKTIEWHRVSLGNKLGADNRVDLVRIAISAGLVDAFAPEEHAAKPSPERGH